MKRSRKEFTERKEIKDWGNHDDNEDKLFTFEPALHIQRKRKVLDEVMAYIYQNYPSKASENPKFKIIDVGCERGAFFQYMQMEFIGVKNKFDTEYVGIDIDEFLLSSQTIDNLKHNNVLTQFDVRNGSISLKLVAESVISPSIVCDRPNVLVMIEVIEHIPLQQVHRLLPKAIFDIIRPEKAIITTPNQDFNVLFGMKSRLQYRHSDHKFEWTRDEFKKWCQRVVGSYSNYKFELSDIGTSEKYHDYGGGSQMAIFTRIGVKPKEPSENLLLESKIVYENPSFYSLQTEYEVVKKFLSNEMSSWAIQKRVSIPKTTNIEDEKVNSNNGAFETYRNKVDVLGDDSIDSMETHSDDERKTDKLDEGFRLDYDDMTGDELFTVDCKLALETVRQHFPEFSCDKIEFCRLIREICETHTFFKYNEENNVLEYLINSGNEYDCDEDYRSSMNDLATDLKSTL